jgi:hypothetical protein
MPDRKIIAKAALHGHIYNLMSCRGEGGNISWQEMRDTEKRKMSFEAYGRSIIWCREENWGIRHSAKDPDDSPEDKSRKGEKKKVKSPYSRQSDGGWQRYLAEVEE